MDQNDSKELAGIQYSGSAGFSLDCKNAVLRLLQFGDDITRVRILSSNHNHCLLLTVNEDLLAIKSGFASGYGGEGPHTFSYVLQLLYTYRIPIEEYEVPSDFLERLDNSALTFRDIENINNKRPIRPTRWYEYIFSEHQVMKNDMTLWKEFPPIIPFSIIDTRIIDLAISFWENPDNNLLRGYRRLEDIVRRRTSLHESGAKLFSKAFNSSPPILSWQDLEDDGERAGRAQLFTGAYSAHRNRRAHREEGYSDSNNQLAEFLLLNHLFCLESTANDLNG
jgi:hypothetical protein